MFTAMRRKDKALTREESLALLAGGEYGTLATIGENGYPYGVPLNYILLGEKIYFHGAALGSKLENLRQNPKACFTVVGNVQRHPEELTTRYESVVAFGHAREVLPERRKEILEHIVTKYAPGFEEQGQKTIRATQDRIAVVELEIEHITGKVSK